MKKLIVFCFSLFIVMACEKVTVDDPVINSFTASKTDIKVGDTVVFKFDALADHGVVWLGDKYPIKPIKPSDYDTYQYTIQHPDTAERVFNSQSDTLHAGLALSTVQMQGKDSVVYIYKDKLKKYKDQDKIKVVFIVSNVGNKGNEIKTQQQEVIITMHK